MPLIFSLYFFPIIFIINSSNDDNIEILNPILIPILSLNNINIHIPTNIIIPVILFPIVCKKPNIL